MVAGSGQVGGRPVLCYAQDYGVAGGSVGEAESAVVVDLLRRSQRSRVPVVGFMESAGARLQEGVSALTAYGRIFYENVALSRQVPQVSIVTGTAAGGGCYSPALTDFIVMTENASMFLTGPGVVREALNEDVTAELLGGSRVHERNGVCHFVATAEPQAAQLARELLGYLPQNVWEPPPALAPGAPTGESAAAHVPSVARRVYDVRQVIGSLVDRGRFLEVSSRWAQNIVVGFARLRGEPIGVVASQPKVLGGVLDVSASQKGAAFVEMCADFGLPLAVLVDTPGFMPGMKQESSGVIRQGARLVRAFAAACVPRVTVILRKAYGGAYIAMNSKSLGADKVVAWPGAEVGVMGARAAAQVLHRRELAASPNAEARLERLARAYARRHLSAHGAAHRGLIDAVIEPEATRRTLAATLTA